MDKIGEAEGTTFEVGKRHQVLHQVKAKRGRKDRHSKVCTAGGTTRDRRVRLSPNTAILFYDLQDRLGCDRPSKAIDWLMSEAKPTIHALHRPPTPTRLFSGEGQGHHHFDANSQFVTLQTTLEYSSAPREPLQSSSSIINTNFPQFQGFGFSDLDL